jgi:DeoR/GlpR family transcriptional regulator of sugar metabolism
MIPEERREEMLRMIREKEICAIKTLVSHFGVSRITIQRDLTDLEEKGFITKIHGGAKFRRQEQTSFETRFDIRYNMNYSKKLDVVKNAMQFVKPHSTIFLDSSTTSHMLGCEIMESNFDELNLITTSPSLICEAMKKPDANVISTGGELRSYFSMFGGPFVIEFLERVHIDCAFISSAGISKQFQFTTSNMELSNILKKVIERSHEVNFLLDSTKIFKQAMNVISGTEKCTRIITDAQADKEAVATIIKHGVEVIL